MLGGERKGGFVKGGGIADGRSAEKSWSVFSGD